MKAGLMMYADSIKQLARDYGFTACGIGRAEELTEDKERLIAWINKGYQGEMNYMEREPQKRVNPEYLLPGARSVIMLAYHYAPNPALIPKPPFTIARFALGLDYHAVLAEKTRELAEKIQNLSGTAFRFKVFCDTSSILEKAWAVKTGMAWRGKNTLVQIPGKGSWFLLSGILTDMELTPDKPYSGQHCGNCRRCLDACPVSALTGPYILDARKCLAYLSLETKGEFEEGSSLKGHLYGCDVCQEVCPYNKPLPFNNHSWLNPNPALSVLHEDEWAHMTEDHFNELFVGSGIRRWGYARFTRNVKHLS